MKLQQTLYTNIEYTNLSTNILTNTSSVLLNLLIYAVNKGSIVVI